MDMVEKSWHYKLRGKKSRLYHKTMKDGSTTLISISPERAELVGGRHDGKRIINKFVFDAGLFLMKSLDKGFELERLALVSRPSKEHQDRMIVILKKKKKVFKIEVLTRPANEVCSAPRKIRIKKS